LQTGNIWPFCSAVVSLFKPAKLSVHAGDEQMNLLCIAAWALGFKFVEANELLNKRICGLAEHGCSPHYKKKIMNDFQDVSDIKIA